MELLPTELLPTEVRAEDLPELLRPENLPPLRPTPRPDTCQIFPDQNLHPYLEDEAQEK